jgi:hypothetical protein
MPTASGGSDVVNAIHTPAMQLPTSIAQIAIGMPELKAPGNMSAPNETILAIRTTDAKRPAIVPMTPSRPTASKRDQASFLSDARDSRSCAQPSQAMTFRRLMGIFQMPPEAIEFANPSHAESKKDIFALLVPYSQAGFLGGQADSTTAVMPLVLLWC